MSSGWSRGCCCENPERIRRRFNDRRSRYSRPLKAPNLWPEDKAAAPSSIRSSKHTERPEYFLNSVRQAALDAMQKATGASRSVVALDSTDPFAALSQLVSAGVTLG